MSEEKTGVFINGKFIECNTSCLEILVKGKVQNLKVGKNDNNTMTMKVSHTTMNNFYGNAISGGVFQKTIDNSGNEIQTMEIPEIKIIVESDIVNLIANVGDVCCKNVDSINATSGDVNVSGNVSGYVKSMSGDIQVLGNLGGNASSISGDVFTNNRKF